MANKPCKRCGSVKWFWSEGDYCSMCATESEKEPKKMEATPNE